MKRSSTSLATVWLVCMAATLSLSGQTERPRPAATSINEAPAWAQAMYGIHPNVWAVDSAYRVWRQAYPAVRTYHTQYYKHWRRAIGSDVSPAGYWQPPTDAARADALRQWQQTRTNNARTTVWENIGPWNTYASGSDLAVSWQANVYCLDQSTSNADWLYAGTEGGSVFRSTDRGDSWTCVSDAIDAGGIRAIAIHPTDPAIVLFGEGRYLWRTDDGGDTWTSVLSVANLRANAIAFHPTDPTVALLAANEGLYRSTNGGVDWTQVHAEKCWDLVFRPGHANTVYLLQSNSNTGICEFYKSTDAGLVWTQKDSGWLDPTANSTADNQDNGARLGVSTADPDRVYALLIGQYNDGVNDNNYLGVYRSDDAGESWTLPNTNSNGGPGGPYQPADAAAGIEEHACLVTFWFNDTHRYPGQESQYNQGFYNLALDVSDTDADNFLVGFLNLFKSEDGGATFTQWGGYGGGPGWQHPDIQDIEINGSDVWVASDGGLNLYATDFATHDAKNQGLAASDFWGFDGGWNEDILTGGRYHNGNTATLFGSYPDGQYIRLGGAEETTGYVHPGGGRKVMHSDISPRILPATVHGPVGGFAFTAYPNEGYAGNNENTSELVPDPRCYNHLYIGHDNELQKSKDGGLSWTTLYSFGNDATAIVTGIEVSRSNPDVIYAVQNANPVKLWKSTDGGTTFVESNVPNGAVNGAFLALSATDADKVWLAWSQGGNSGNKIFESMNGGTDWTNLTTSTLNGHYIEQLIHIGGTDDGLYLGTNFGVFYRSDSEADWQACSDGLPVRAKINRLVPFYAKSKVRIATYHRGIWQADMEEAPATLIAQATVDKLAADCARDTFQFDDYSMIEHSAASWAWSFAPAPAWVEGTTLRNPKVVFGTSGTYTATLTVNGTATSTLTVTVSDGCNPETVPGNALSLDPDGYAIASHNLELNSNTVTLTCWVKAAEVQNDRAVMLFARGGTTVTGLGFDTGRRLSYHWDGGQWWWDSGLTVPADTWTHVALVVTPTAATIYLNGVGATNAVAHAAEAFDTPLVLGYDANSTARRLTGQLDEVTVWNRALSQDEIRESMHLTQVPATADGLVSYYQFNETQGVVLDRVDVAHLSPVGTAARTASTAPVGGGTSARATVTAAGTYDFGTTGMEMTFPAGGTLPAGELCVSRLDLSPDQLPTAAPHSQAYWIVNNYGTNTDFTELTEVRFSDYGTIPAGADSEMYRLYKRSSFADGPTWGDALAQATAVEAGVSGSVTYGMDNGITSFSQFVIVEESILPVDWQDFRAALQSDGSVRLYWSVYQTEDVSHFVIERSTDGSTFVPLGQVPAREGAGTFAYQAVDNAPTRGLNFYRLRQLDENGQVDYSAVRQILVDGPTTVWTFYPNPVATGAPMQISTTYVGSYQLLVYDSRGRICLSRTLSGDTTLDDLSLRAGVYAYQIVTPGKRWMGKWVIE